MEYVQPKKIIIQNLVKSKLTSLMGQILAGEGIEPPFLDFLLHEKRIPVSVLKFRENLFHFLKVYGEDYNKWKTKKNYYATVTQSEKLGVVSYAIKLNPFEAADDAGRVI